MNYGKYVLIKNELSTVFNFVSIGHKGNFRKVVIYSATKNPNVYNLGFGDLKYDPLKKNYDGFLIKRKRAWKILKK